MLATPSSTQPLKAVSPRHAVLEELIALALRDVSDGFRDLCTTLAGLLVDGDRLHGDAASIAVRIRAGNLIRERHFALLHLAASELERALRRELAQLAPEPAVRVPEQELSLVPYEEMDQRVTLGAVSRPFDTDHANALATLNARLARLFDRATLRANPFRPEVFVAALLAAWAEFYPEEGGDGLLLPLLKPGRFHDLGRLYGALNLALERHGVHAGPVGRAQQAAHDGRRQAALSRHLRRFFDDAAGGQDFVPVIGDDGIVTAAPASADRRLLNWLAGLPRPAAADGPPATSSDVRYLPALKREAPAGSLSRVDEGTIDLLAAVFDTVFADQGISPESRDLLQLLQVPALKAALTDKEFFFQDEHPARRLIELLSRMGWERTQRGEQRLDDPQYAAMRRSVDCATRDGDEVTAAFAHAVRELEAALKEEEADAAAAIAEPVAAALKQEKTAAARRAARDAVAQRLGGGDVLAVVEGFLEHRWTDVLTVAYSIEDDKPGAVRHATQAMDDLVWSVQPKLTQEERKRFIAKLPALLATLNKWLDVIRWQDADRLRFFAELADCHASIVRAPLDLAPERRVELALHATQRAAERRVAPPAPEEDAGTAGLERGMWLSFDMPEGVARKVKLAWISPLRTLFIFSNGAREEAFSLAAEVLAQRVRDGSAAVLQTEGIVVRALSQALAVNDAEPAAA